MTDVKDIVARVDSLPPLPATSVRLLGVINDPGSTIRDIVETIKYDQALTSDVLRLCNSAYFGLSRQITSLNEAMVRLGTTKILQLVMSVHATSALSQAQQGYGLGVGVLWKHSVAVAQGSALVAQRLQLSNVNLAFTAGLLHDIGKVILSQHVADEFQKIIHLVCEEKRSFVEAERAVLGFDHTEIGAMLAERWKLPENIVRCIRYHHEPGRLEIPDGIVDAVYLANCVCLMLGIGLGADGLSYRADESVVTRHHLTESDLEGVGVAVLADLEQMKDAYDEETGRS